MLAPNGDIHQLASSQVPCTPPPCALLGSRTLTSCSHKPSYFQSLIYKPLSGASGLPMKSSVSSPFCRCSFLPFGTLPKPTSSTGPSQAKLALTPAVSCIHHDISHRHMSLFIYQIEGGYVYATQTYEAGQRSCVQPWASRRHIFIYLIQMMCMWPHFIQDKSRLYEIVSAAKGWINEPSQVIPTPTYVSPLLVLPTIHFKV